jgi:hypothetical protein
MHDTTFLTTPLSYSQACDTFRAAARTARRTGCGTVSFTDDFNNCPSRHRFIQEHRSKHRPASIVNGLSHFRFAELGRTYVAYDDSIMFSDKPCRGYMKEVFALVGDLCRQSAGAGLLASALEYSKLLLSLTVKRWHFNFVAVADAGERLESKVYAYLRDNLTLLGLRHLNLDIYIPPATAVGGKLKGLGYSIIGDVSGEPKAIAAAHNRQPAAFHLGGALEVGEWNPIKAALLAAETRSLWEACLPGVCKFAANSVNRVGMDTKFLGNASAQFGKVERRRTFNVAASLPASVGFPVYLTAEIPHKVYRTSLRSQRPPGGRRAIFNSVAICEKHRSGRRTVSAVFRSRGREVLAHLTASSSVTQNLTKRNQRMRFLLALKGAVSSGIFLMRMLGHG